MKVRTPLGTCEIGPMLGVKNRQVMFLLHCKQPLPSRHTPREQVVPLESLSLQWTQLFCDKDNLLKLRCTLLMQTAVLCLQHKAECAYTGLIRVRVSSSGSDDCVILQTSDRASVRHQRRTDTGRTQAQCDKNSHAAGAITALPARRVCARAGRGASRPCGA